MLYNINLPHRLFYKIVFQGQLRQQSINQLFYIKQNLSDTLSPLIVQIEQW